MKLNFKKLGSYYSAWINDANVKYGWYDSGRAFIAKNDEVMTYKQAYKEFVPKRPTTRKPSTAFSRNGHGKRASTLSATSRASQSRLP